MKIGGLTSKNISLLKFVLMIEVVLIHARIPDSIKIRDICIENHPIYDTISYIVGNIVCESAVPLFFFLSGYLFFNTDSFSFGTYKDKIKKRLSTLLIPYLVWNIITILVYFVVQSFFINFVSSQNKMICNYDFIDYLDAFWSGSCKPLWGGTPICPQLWFLRDLIVLVLISPILFYLLKKIPIYFVGILGGLYWVDIISPIAGFNILSVFFFCLGGYYRIKYKDIIPRGNSAMICILYVVLVTIDFLSRDSSYIGYLHRIILILGGLVMLRIGFFIVRRCTLKDVVFWANSSFFIYVTHNILLSFLSKVIFKFIIVSDCSLLLVYLFDTIVVSIVGIGMYYIVQNRPLLLKLLTGGR